MVFMIKMTVSIVIPAYNEEKYIINCLQRVIVADTLGIPKEIIVVDDGSQDKTASLVRSFVSGLRNKQVVVKFLTQKVNTGKSAVVKKGLLATTGDIVIIQDADLEYNPNDYPELLRPFIDNEADVVYGSRFISNKPHRVLYFWHYQINRILTTLSNMMTNLNLTDMETGYKAFRGNLVRTIARDLTSHRFGFEPEITARIAKVKEIKIFEVGIGYFGRTYAEGKKISWKDGVHAVWEIFKYSLTS